MSRHFGKWARRQHISCYRIYDADIPQFPFSIDIYEKYLYISEYRTDYYFESAAEHETWLYQCLATIATTLETPLDHIFMKEREEKKGTQQYGKIQNEQKEFVMKENGLQFLVNLSDYLDTGLFLDHRDTRQMVREEAKDKRVLNLFAYTGSFTVYAAAGGAKKTTTVDLSKTYLTWAQKNLIINDLWNEKQHHLIHADVKQYLQTLRATPQFDLIILDPPTFSNSKRMDDVLDVQRDHVDLIKYCLRIMPLGGVLYFSTNFRRFKPNFESITASDIKDITAQTIPNDFRDKKIHQCFKFTK